MKKIILFIFIPILLTTAGEFLLKHTINSLPPIKTNTKLCLYTKNIASNFISNQHAINTTVKIAGILQKYVLSPHIIFATFSIVFGGVLWLIAMSKFELSFLYPFLSINYICIIVGSQILLNEEVSIFRYISIALIIIGLIVISKSPYSENIQEDET